MKLNETIIKKKKKGYNNRSLNAFFILCFLCFVSSVYGLEPLVVTFLDVWQGDAILIQTPQKKVILFDGGQSSNEDYNSFFDAGRDVVTPFLKQKKIKHIDVIVMTHAHRDHVGGLLNVLEEFSVGEVLDPGYIHTSFVYERFLKSIKDKNIPFLNPKSGEELFWDETLEVMVLNPPGKFFSGANACNENSLVIKMKYKNVSFLFTGDIGKKAKAYLVKTFGEKLENDIIKISHQGSDTSFLESFLKKASPEKAIISVGRGNKFNHPGDKVLEFLQREEIQLFRTDRDGFIELSTDGTGFGVDILGKLRFSKSKKS